ncbi:hypothetical protein niasHT_014747 [Heterodera trifolii]|uniref:Secreted protein n=1 Tax=Heterodera trifolii TaxID=157864 RepID=A0ABD2L6E3_9BILA
MPFKLFVCCFFVVIPFCAPFNWPWEESKDDCINALRYRDGTPPPELVEFAYANVRPEYQDKAKKEDIVKNTYQEDCLPGAFIGIGYMGCQTLVCKDKNGNDIFRVNACVQDKNKCPQKFHDICKAKGGEGNCEFCSEMVDKKVCNSLPEKINLDQSHPVPEPTKLTIVIEPQVISGVGVTKTTVFSSHFYIIVFGAMAAYFMALIR